MSGWEPGPSVAGPSDEPDGGSNGRPDDRSTVPGSHDESAGESDGGPTDAESDDVSGVDLDAVSTDVDPIDAASSVDRSTEVEPPDAEPADARLAGAGAVEAVCFDLDDTLFDFTQYVRAGLAAAADRIEEREGAALHDELHALYFEEGVTEGTFDALVDRHGVDAALVPELVEAYHERVGELTPYERAEHVLAALAPTYRLGLVTDGRNGRAKLERLGFDGYFEAACVAPEHDATKLEERPFVRVLASLGVEPRRAVYVGDDPRTDFPVPNALGMRTVRLRRGRFADREPAEGEAPDVTIDRLDELLALLPVDPDGEVPDDPP